MKLWLLSAYLLVFAFGEKATAKIFVNEVMVNEPGGRVSLEWFELYNRSNDSATLLNDTLTIGSLTIATFGDITIAPFEFVVIARNVIAFEEHWGDSSGVWGDDRVLENYTLAQLSFSLKNTAGILTVFDDTAGSSLSWPSAGADGVSWERVSASVDSSLGSMDVSGSTPGRTNTATTVDRDWEIVTLDVVTVSGAATRLDVTVRNAGKLSLPGACLILYLSPQLSPTSPYGISGDSLLCHLFHALKPAEAVTFSVSVEVAGVYDTVGISVVGSDDRSTNNLRIITIPGVDFPPVVINEFMANPKSPLQSEWVELKNVTLLPFSIVGWRLGDELGFGLIDTSRALSLTIAPGDYLVIAQNPTDVASFYGLPSLPNSVSGWRALNNAGDVVRLQDVFGFTVDSFEYRSVFEDNVTWSRSEETRSGDLWGRSTISGGTPNDSNQTLLNPSATSLSVSVSKNPFSPDGDGLDETTSIDILAPDGGKMSVTIYDLDGRDLRHLFNGAPFTGSLIWDGATDSGRRVNIGIYIIYVEIEGVASIKRTVVVAR